MSRNKNKRARYCPDCGGIVTKDQFRALVIQEHGEADKRKAWCFTCSQCRKIYGVHQVLRHKPSGALWEALKKARGNR